MVFEGRGSARVLPGEKERGVAGGDQGSRYNGSVRSGTRPDFDLRAS